MSIHPWYTLHQSEIIVSSRVGRVDLQAVSEDLHGLVKFSQVQKYDGPEIEGIQVIGTQLQNPVKLPERFGIFFHLNIGFGSFRLNSQSSGQMVSAFFQI